MSEKLSILTTAVIAAFGWLVTHYVDRLTSTPSVEYRIETRKDTTGYRHTYRLKNINRTQAFGPIDLNLQAYPDNPIKAYTFNPLEPASEGEAPHNVLPTSAELTIPKLMPGAEIIVMLRTSAGNRPTLKVESPNSVIRLTPRNLETWIVAREMTIVSVLIGIWAVTLLLLFLPRRRAVGPPPEDAR